MYAGKTDSQATTCTVQWNQDGPCSDAWQHLVDNVNDVIEINPGLHHLN